MLFYWRYSHNIRNHTSISGTMLADLYNFLHISPKTSHNLCLHDFFLTIISLASYFSAANSRKSRMNGYILGENLRGKVLKTANQNTTWVLYESMVKRNGLFAPTLGTFFLGMALTIICGQCSLNIQLNFWK